MIAAHSANRTSAGGGVNWKPSPAAPGSGERVGRALGEPPSAEVPGPLEPETTTPPLGDGCPVWSGGVPEAFAVLLGPGCLVEGVDGDDVGPVVTAGVGIGVGCGVGTAVGGWVGLGVGLGVGATTLKLPGRTPVSVTVFAPAPLPDEAVNE